MSRAIVTGATGMLGVALTERLLKEGYEVIAIARPGSSRIMNIPDDEKVTVVELDLNDIGSLPGILNEAGIDSADLFFHFSWEGTHGSSRDDVDLQMKNIENSIEAVRAASKMKCEVFLGAGSQAECGPLDYGVKVAPDTPCFPVNGYGIGKLCAGQMTRLEAGRLNIRHIWCRILSVYGPYDGAHTMVMSGIGMMIEGKKASYTKAEQMWDYIYCKDAARAMYLAAVKGRDKAVYSIGSGNVRPLSEYITAIRDAIDPSLPIGFGEIDYYPGQVMYLCADTSSLVEDTGFEPEYTFEKGIEETVEWFREEFSV